jgi:hypothetical protein
MPKAPRSGARGSRFAQQISFDPARLRAAMPAAKASQPRLLYYQGWAEGGNYRVIDRKPCRFVKAGEVACAIQVKDDLVPALGIPYDVTDTFHLSFTGDRIVEVRNTSDDPPEFEQALKWLGRERPQLLEGPCKGFFDGGPTPGDCVRAVVKGFGEFKLRATPSRP